MYWCVVDSHLNVVFNLLMPAEPLDRSKPTVGTAQRLVTCAIGIFLAEVAVVGYFFTNVFCARGSGVGFATVCTFLSFANSVFGFDVSNQRLFFHHHATNVADDIVGGLDCGTVVFTGGCFPAKETLFNIDAAALVAFLSLGESVNFFQVSFDVVQRVQFLLADEALQVATRVANVNVKRRS